MSFQNCEIIFRFPSCQDRSEEHSEEFFFFLFLSLMHAFVKNLFFFFNNKTQKAISLEMNIKEIFNRRAVAACGTRRQRSCPVSRDVVRGIRRCLQRDPERKWRRRRGREGLLVCWQSRRCPHGGGSKHTHTRVRREPGSFDVAP